MQPLYALLVGVAMGALIQRVGASSPGMIARNLRLENLSVIKFMAVTIAVGGILAYVAGLFVPMHWDIKPLYVVGVVVGGLIFGVGFAVGGYCPGTCVVGVGEGRKDAWFALLGGVIGALVFTLVYELAVAPIVKMADLGKVTVAGALNISPVLVAASIAVVFLAAVALLPTDVKKPG
jgi:uncharacterized membrane protein YedE/YeeE